MSLTTIFGVLGALGLFIGAIIISTDNFIIFLSGSSFIMVMGGTLASTFISYEPRYVLLSLKLIWRIIFSPKVGRNVLKSEVGRIIKWAYTVQKSGVPALEAEAMKATRGDKFLRFGVEMVVSGYTGEEVREIMTNTIETTYGRNTVQVYILKDMASAAPAFGMIGTLVGLVQMLADLEDPASIGPAMAVALLTTLYGAVIANLVALPIADKLANKIETERINKSLIIDAVIGIQAGQRVHMLAEILETYLPDNKRGLADDPGAGEAPAAEKGNGNGKKG